MLRNICFEFSSSPFTMVLAITGLSLTLGKCFKLPDIIWKFSTVLPFVKKVYDKYHHFVYEPVSIKYFPVCKLQISHLIKLKTSITFYGRWSLLEKWGIREGFHILYEPHLYSLKRTKTKFTFTNFGLLSQLM